MANSTTPKKSYAPLCVLGTILFISGFCSLAYQVVWLREFRLLFGGATPAASAVLAVFMGGLGIGGAVLGAMVEKSKHPGRFYALIEAGITIAAILSPFLLIAIQSLYIRTGGIQSLGLTFATLLQIGMTALVIGPSCFLMGGTLPAALKFAQSNHDVRRATTALFYGLNVCGAVSGAFLANFVMLPAGGNMLTLFTAGFANAVIALAAWILMQRVDGGEPMPEAEEKILPSFDGDTAPTGFIYAAAFTSGFVFFLIELVWYRASIPLFGGSVYNFGLILAVALAGIGVGSLLYSLFLRQFRPTLTGFSLVSGLLAFFIILPFVLGDHLAYFALLLNNFFQPRSFEGLIFGWTVICGILVFLPAFFSGIQFPLMISLVGRGNRGIGRQIGRTYAWNTLGAVTGALLGGFVLIPILSIPTCWRIAAIAAVCLSLGSLAIGLMRRLRSGNKCPRWIPTFTGAGCVGVVFFCIAASGPSSYWFHHPIGYGRANDLFGQPANAWIDYVRTVNRGTQLAIDGRETSVSLQSNREYAVFTNGKSDSSAIGDGPTTVMVGLTGAALHPSGAENVCVVGLATGITVGWLTQVEEVKSVDVVELEKGMIDLSRYFSAVNFGAIDHPKTQFVHGDAREFFTTRAEKHYDLIISVPSNLHRAGVANLYTQEFYASLITRMSPDAIFCQWVQAYETDMESTILVIATLRSVFPKVELWQTLSGDLLLICSLANEPWNFDLAASRLNKEPFRTAMRNTWFTTTPEGFFARNIGNPDFVDRLAAQADTVNTDDHNLIEFAFGRKVGAKNNVMHDLIRNAFDNSESTPWMTSTSGQFRPSLWAEETLWKSALNQHPPELPKHPSGEAWPAHLENQLAFLRTRSRKNPKQPAAEWPHSGGAAAAMIFRAETLAMAGHADFKNAVEVIRDDWPVDAAIYEGRHAEAEGRQIDALDHYFMALANLQNHHWTRRGAPDQAMQRINQLLSRHAAEAESKLEEWFEVAARPFPYAALGDLQREILMTLATHLPGEFKLRAIESWGTHFPWRENYLRFREATYRELDHPDWPAAQRDLERFMR